MSELILIQEQRAILRQTTAQHIQMTTAADARWRSQMLINTGGAQ